MKITVTKKDIEKGGSPIYNSVKREYNKECIVDKKFIVFEGGTARRLPVSAEAFQYAVFTGVADLEPFEFEI